MGWTGETQRTGVEWTSALGGRGQERTGRKSQISSLFYFSGRNRDSLLGNGSALE